MPDPGSTSLPVLPFIVGKTSLTPKIEGASSIRFQLTHTRLSRREGTLIDAFFGSVRGRVLPWTTHHHPKLAAGKCYFDSDKIVWEIHGKWASTRLPCRFKAERGAQAGMSE